MHFKLLQMCSISLIQKYSLPNIKNTMYENWLPWKIYEYMNTLASFKISNDSNDDPMVNICVCVL